MLHGPGDKGEYNMNITIPGPGDKGEYNMFLNQGITV